MFVVLQNLPSSAAYSLPGIVRKGLREEKESLVKELIKRVANRNRLTVEQVLSKDRSREIVHCKRVIIYQLLEAVKRDELEITKTEIGKYLNIIHSTVIHHYRTALDRIKYNKEAHLYQ